MAEQPTPAGAEFFIYGAEFTPIPASSSDTQRIQIDSGSDFLITQITGDCRDLDTNDTPITDPAVLVLLKTSEHKELMDRAVRWSAFIGSGKEPYILPAPKLLKQNSVLEVYLTNGTAAAKRCRIYFHGYKLF